MKTPGYLEEEGKKKKRGSADGLSYGSADVPLWPLTGVNFPSFSWQNFDVLLKFQILKRLIFEPHKGREYFEPHRSLRTPIFSKNLHSCLLQFTSRARSFLWYSPFSSSIRPKSVTASSITKGRVVTVHIILASSRFRSWAQLPPVLLNFLPAFQSLSLAQF